MDFGADREAGAQQLVRQVFFRMGTAEPCSQRENVESELDETFLGPQGVRDEAFRQDGGRGDALRCRGDKQGWKRVHMMAVLMAISIAGPVAVTLAGQQRGFDDDAAEGSQ